MTPSADHDCLASVPMPIGAGAWRELAIPNVTTWRCGCGREWVWQRGGWERLVDADTVARPAESVTSAEGWAAARALATQLLEDRVGRPATRDLALRVLGEGMPEPPELRVEYRTSYTIRHERGCPNGGAIPERGACAACGAEMVHESEVPIMTVTPSTDVETEAEAAWRNVGGDAGDVEAEGG